LNLGEMITSQFYTCCHIHFSGEIASFCSNL